MKKYYIISCLLFIVNSIFSQVVFTDNFNTSTGATYTNTVGAIGSSAVWNMNRSGIDWCARINGGILDCSNDSDASGPNNANGWTFAHTSTAAFSSPYNPQLNLNTTTITWTFNMRQIRTDPAGFGAGSYGVAFILAGSNNDGAAGSTGYAVALGQSLSTDPIRLIKYNNGLQGAIANIITSNTAGLTDFGANYLSIKVTYTPSTDTWELFLRDDGLSAFVDPATGTLVSQGTAVDNTFTGQNLGFMGGYWQGATAVSQTAFFDNINVSLASTNSALSDIITDATFITPTNINYGLHQGTVLTLTNSIEVAKFTIRDGGGAADADAVGTILNSISFSLSNPANIRRVAILDGAIQLQELAGAATLNFTGLTLTAADGSTKNFSLRVVFANNVTDNQQFQLAVTAATAAFTGSQFAANNAGGAASSIVGDENRIEITADGLTYFTNTFSPTGNGLAMAPAVQIGATDTLNFSGNLYTNLDLDFVDQINITSTGTLTGSPVTVIAAAGVANFAGLIHPINGTALTLNAERTTTLDWDATSNPFDIINGSTATDYFRSVQDGNWNNSTTWESSFDNATWQASTLVPNSAANNITVRSGHTVTITANASTDQLLVQGNLVQNNTPIFTIDNGPDTYDMFVATSGTFTMNGRQPIGAGSVGVNLNGTIRIASNPTPSEGDDFAYGGHAVANVTFLNYSYYTWATNTATPSWSGRTYFTPGNRTYWIFTATPNFSLGGANPTVIHGVLTAFAPITIVGAGTKTFVNGIFNAPLIDASFATGGSINITGADAELGEDGSILLPNAGLNIGPNTTLNCISNPPNYLKTLSGNVNFGANTKVILNDIDLTVTGSITGTNATSYFVTNGLTNAGKLVRPNVGASPVEFPIGFSDVTYNPLTISNGSNLTYGAKVFNNIIPTIFDNARAVNRTWVVLPSGTPSGAVNVTFNYNPGEGNANFNYATDVELGLYTNVWNVIQTGITPTGTYAAPTSVTAFGGGIEAPMVIGNLGAILAVQKSIQLTAVRQNNTVKLNWNATNLPTVKKFIIEYSSNGITYFPLATKTSSDYSYVDDRQLNKTNYYRIKSIDLNNAIVYSNVTIISSAYLPNLYLNSSITTSSITLNAITNKQQNIQLVILDAVGKQIETQKAQLTIGQNSIIKNVSHLNTGIYYIVIYYTNGDKTLLRFVKM